MKRYLFFLRSHNDTDNIVPAIWFLLDDDPVATVDIVYYHFDFPYLAHPYIGALQSRFADRLRIKWIGTFLALNYDQILSHEKISTAQTKRIREALGLDWNGFERVLKKKVGILRRLHDRPPTLSLSNLTSATSHIGARSPCISQEARQAFIAWVVGQGQTPCLAVFDHQRGTSLLGFFDALRGAGIEKIVRLPVSPKMNVNVLRRTRYVVLNRENMASELDFAGFDAVSYTDRFYPENLRHFFTELGWGDPLAGKLAVLGAIRYCPEWLAARPQPPAFSSSEDDRIKLVFFLSRPEVNSFWDEVKRTIRVFDSFPRFHVIVQPHPRDVKALDVAGTRTEIHANVPAPSLIDWANVVMLWGSSIGLEALIKEKTLLCLTYLNANRSLYEMLGGSWLLHCRDDLVLALAKLERDPTAREYRQADVDRLIREVVFAGESKPVPARYLQFIRANEKTQ